MQYDNDYWTKNNVSATEAAEILHGGEDVYGLPYTGGPDVPEPKIIENDLFQNDDIDDIEEYITKRYTSFAKIARSEA